MKDGVTGSHGVLYLGNNHPQSAEKSSVNLGKVKMFPAVLEQLLNRNEYMKISWFLLMHPIRR